ncbi:UNVERIFIED_CONTAM: hypothetical protein GTU68_046733 [Idotea baltica]|nr:hypothetical protein [Idotea baltica]
MPPARFPNHVGMPTSITTKTLTHPEKWRHAGADSSIASMNLIHSSSASRLAKPWESTHSNDCCWKSPGSRSKTRASRPNACAAVRRAFSSGSAAPTMPKSPPSHTTTST